MPLSWNEIRDRAIAFSREWEGESSEDAEAKSFLDKFFNVFGVLRRRVASFEKHVKKIDGKDGYIDLLWPGVILVEMKSRGKDLGRAHTQARGYFPNLKDAELPRYILVCDFENFRLYDLEPEVREDMFKDSEAIIDFKLKDLHKNIKYFSFIAGYETQTYKEQDVANIEAAELMGTLHDELKAIGYTGHDLEVLLVRLLFCLFADDTGIFLATHPFERYIRNRTAQDGSDLAAKLSEMFEVLNQREDTRLKNLDEQLNDFPYVNGKLFADRIRTAAFSRKMREHLLECCEFNWSAISPAIFGALFQSIMDDKARRNLGAHYTSEKNILKLIKPLFLDELREEFERIKKNPNKLAEFHTKLRNLAFLDPACGGGNFLVITYRELRSLEMDVLRSLQNYDTPKSEPHEAVVSTINPYLAAASNTIVIKQQKPIVNLPTMRCGNKPADGGYLILSERERDELISREPQSAKWIRRYVGSEELINDVQRWCLWLRGIEPSELRTMPHVLARVNCVKDKRLASTAEPTRAAASRPYEFFFISQPSTSYIAIPEVSSERRTYVPIAILPKEIIASNKVYVLADANLMMFGVLHSSMHMAWLATVGGRLKSDFQYSATMVYNSFPWPATTQKQKQTIQEAAQGVLDARAQFPNSSLADLYDPLTMPPTLLKAHQTLDRAVDVAYGKKSFPTEAARVAFLFEEYQKLTAPLLRSKALN